MSCYLLSGSFLTTLSLCWTHTSSVGCTEYVVPSWPFSPWEYYPLQEDLSLWPHSFLSLNCTQVLSLMIPGPAESPILSSPSHESDPLGFCCSSLPVGRGLKIFGDFAAPFSKVEVENTNHPC